MMEYLFKGKTTDNINTKDGLWVFGLPFYKEGKIGGIESKDGKLYAVIPETISPFSGLTDKNGKKIFEGDIVKTKYGRLCVVEWRSTPCFCGFDLTVCANWDDFGKAPSSWDLYMPQNLEIVGNIHDNKELLGE